MSSELALLVATAGWLGLVHTLVGPDHYVPFVALAKVRRWNLSRTLVVTALCGLGHVVGSIVLGGVGIAIGAALVDLELIESFRGDIAAWGLTVFGVLYMAWGIRRALRPAGHHHAHHHEEAGKHSHEHVHWEGDSHHQDTHASPEHAPSTPWLLFIVFVLGPCEPLIPLLMYPAARESPVGVGVVASVFAVVTIATMLTAVAALSFGLKLVPLHRLERATHALAGGAVMLCGVGMLVGL